MTRTLCYSVYHPEPLDSALVARIKEVQRELNNRFTLQSSLELRFEDLPEEDALGEHHNPRVVAGGTMTVGSNDWPIEIATRFMSWVSEQIPLGVVVLSDPSRYLLPGIVGLDQGRMMNSEALGRNAIRSWDPCRIVATGIWKYAELIHVGNFRAPTKATEVRDVPEIARIGLSKMVLSLLTVTQVAEFMTFPWQRSRSDDAT